MPPVNRLATETSPYLRQHADNPVDWYPWGPEAFAVARETDRPVLLSVGYSACHWCHVMAHESFEDPETAALMNRLFVNVKVDREERPDVDAIYMEATQAMTGSGGWPMTVFMDADGAPFYCGTYFPRTGRGGMPSFTQLCAAIDDAWRHKREGLAEQAQHLTEYLRRQPKFNTDAEPVGVEALGQGEEQLLRQHDTRWGGFGGAPKFPQSMSVDLLLHQALRTGSTEALAAATRSLDAMCAGGMYDHLGGGFARYSVDEQWLVPHFEKMLYDNALLLRPYLHAWQMTGNAAYRRVVDETITYLLRDLRHPDGGFFSAEDADSLDAHGHSEEGAFYVWSLDELHDVVAAATDDATATLFEETYGVTRSGNFETGSILFRSVGAFGDDGDHEQAGRLAAARHALFEHRGRRSRPGLDDKVLTEWNGLLLASLAEAAAACGEPAWLEAAVAQAEFLCRELRGADGRWHRSWQADGGARHAGYAHDYAALVDGFTRLYEATGSLRWLDEARATATAMLDLFEDTEAGGLFTTGHDAEALISRPKDLMDNATPSALSTAAIGLQRLAALGSADDPETARYSSSARTMMAILGHVAGETPLAFANLLLAIELDAVGITEVVIVGDRPDLVAEARATWRPLTVLAWGETGNGSLWEARENGLAYVCEGQVCHQPVGTAAELAAQLGRGSQRS